MRIPLHTRTETDLKCRTCPVCRDRVGEKDDQNLVARAVSKKRTKRQFAEVDNWDPLVDETLPMQTSLLVEDRASYFRIKKQQNNDNENRKQQPHPCLLFYVLFNVRLETPLLIVLSRAEPGEARAIVF